MSTSTTPPDAAAPAGRPLLVTMGDPAGIGPECVLQAFHRGALAGCVVVGSAAVLRRAGVALGRPAMLAVLDGTASRPFDGWPDAVPPGSLAVVEPPGLPEGLDALPWGRVDARAGRASALCVDTAAGWVLDGQAEALVTAPIHKAAWAAAGIHDPGHTERLQALSARGGPLPPVRMMLTNGELSVVLVTIHLALRAAIDALSTERILQTLQITDHAWRQRGLPRPRIAVAGLNPHAGEDGLFGDEEQRLIAPAIAAARSQGLDVCGPFPPDTVFMRARHTSVRPGAFDVVVAMTHDHGLIPVKYLGVENGVNVTLGLPLRRTSPDHGTAFDIAGTGVADPRSLEAAVRYARGDAPRGR
jgi:4-hydroxythreonine-4-phosphate dehydrogenase